jgi:hypothetical protein
MDVLEKDGFSFDCYANHAVVADDDGHLEFVERVELVGGADELRKRLRAGEQILVECRNVDIFFACCFAFKYSNPFMSFGWPSRSFYELEQSAQDEYWTMLRRVARACNSAFVIIVNEPPDYFEDRFLEIDGQRVIEKKMPNGFEYDILSVWVDDESLDPLPIGIDESVVPGFTGDFFQYSV